MLRAAIVDSAGVVVDVIILDSLDQKPGAILCPEHIGVGMLITEPVPPTPPPPVPSTVTVRQARLALLSAGLLAQVNTAVAAMTGAAGDAARIEWEFSNTVERNKPLVVNISATLGLTSAQLDALFIAASKL